MKVASISVYPIKSARGISVATAATTPTGLMGDRRWMIVDEEGRFLTQREEPDLARLMIAEDAYLDDRTSLQLFIDNATATNVEIPDGTSRREVVVWRSTVDAAATDASVSRWLSTQFGRPLHLVYMDRDNLRYANPDWTEGAAPVSFADGYPILVTTTGSLKALNKRIAHNGGQPVTMARFRPNIVIDHDGAWEEDTWSTLQIGEVTIDLVKPCDRCTVTTQDQKTGTKISEEPLHSLRQIRFSKDRRVPGLLFGWNSVPRVHGKVTVDDPVEVISRREGGWPIRAVPA